MCFYDDSPLRNIDLGGESLVEFLGRHPSFVIPNWERRPRPRFGGAGRRTRELLDAATDPTAGRRCGNSNTTSASS